MGMIRKGRKRLGATRDSLRSQAGVGKETLGGCRESHGETPRDERLFEVTEVGADVRFVERDGLHQRRRFMLELADAQAQFERLWPLADLFLQPKVRSAPEAAGPEDARRERWIDQSALTSFAREERRGGGMAEDPVCPHAPLIDANDLEQRIARRPEEASRTEACMVDSSSVRNRRIKARSCNL